MQALPVRRVPGSLCLVHCIPCPEGYWTKGLTGQTACKQVAATQSPTPRATRSPTPVPPTPPPRPTSSPTPAPTPDKGSNCTNGPHSVEHGWLGAGHGDEYCNLCSCMHGVLKCQAKQCGRRQMNGHVCSHTFCTFTAA